MSLIAGNFLLPETSHSLCSGVGPVGRVQAANPAILLLPSNSVAGQEFRQ